MKDERKTKAQLVSELVELRQQFDSFLYFLPDALIEVDILTPRLTRMNRAAYNLFGYTEQDSAEIQIPQLFAENEYERAVEVITGYVAESQESGVEYVRSGKQELYEFLMRKRDGSVFHAETQTAFILDKDSIPIRMQTIIRDITERKRSEEALRRVGLELAAQMDLDKLLHSIVSQAIELMRGTDGGLYIHRPEQDVLEWAVAIGPNVTPVGTVLRRGVGLAGKVWETGETIIVDDYQHWDGRAAAYSDHPFTAIVGVPVRWGDEFLGVLNIHTDSPRTFSASDAELLSLFATQAAIAIRNARLYKAAQQELTERVRAEKDLRASEEYTRNLIESSLDTIISVDLERHIVAFNKAAQETFGYSAEEILGKHIDMLYADPQDGLQVHQTTIEAGRCVREAPGLRKDGQVFPSLISASALHDARGELVGVMGVSRDITERKRAEAQLQRRLEEMALLNRITTLTASAWDVAGALHEVCAEMARFLQIPQAYLALLNPQRTAAEVVADCHPPGSPGAMGVIIPVESNPSLAYILEHKVPLAVTQAQTDPLLAAVHDTMRRQGIQSMLLVPVLVEEEVIGALRFGASQRQEFNKADVDLVQHIAGQIGQVLMRRRAEEALREGEELYRSLFDGVPVGIYRSTPSGEFLDVNLALVQILGYPDRETLLAASAVDVYLKTDDRQRWQTLLEREGVVRDFETRMRRHDGTPIWVRDTGRIVRDADGSVLCYEGGLEDITARNLATQALRRYSDRLQTLHQIDQAILAAQSPDMIIQPVLRYFGQLIPCWAVSVVMFDFEADEVIAFISDTIAFESERQAGIRLPLATFKDIEEGIAELERGEVYVVKDLLSIFPPSQMLQIVEAQKERPAIAVPLRFQEELIGLIGFGVDSPDDLTPEHIAIAREVAASLAVAFRQARLLEETQAQWREAETLRQAGATLAETLSLDETLDRILEQLDQVVPYDSASVQLLREGQMEIVGGRGFPEPESVIGLKFPVPDDNPNTTVVVERRPVLLADVQVSHPPFRESPHSHIHSWLGVPLFFRGRVIGILAVDSAEQAHFDDRHVRLIAPFATQAAIAIENARLYEQAQKEIAERERVDGALRQRNRELALLNRASQSLASTLDLDQVLATVLGEVRRLLDVTACSVWLIDSDTDELICLQAVTPQDEMVRGWRLAPGQGICGWVARHGKSSIVRDVWADERYFRGVDEQTELGLRAILTVPLLTKEGVIGVLQVLDTEVGRFDDTDLKLLEPLVASAAIAIENARLYEEARQRVAELEALQHISLQLTSTLDLSAVLNTIAESALTLMAATDCHIYLYDEASNTFTFGTALWENGRREAAVETPRSDGFTATVAQKGHAMVINDTARHPLYTTPEAQKWGIQAIAGFPLKRAGRVLGVFTIAFLTPHTFGEDDLRVLGLLADQAASAIENARLYEETAKRLAQTEVLREMMLAAASTLNFDQVLNRTIEILERALGVEYLGFMLPDENGEFMKSHPSILGFTPPEGGFRFPTDQCITGQAYRTGQPVIVSDVREATGYAVADEETRSELAVPVRVGDDIVAVLNLESSKLDAFGDEELTFYTAVAGQLGVAMENARLYEQARRDAETKAMLLREVNHRVKNNLTAIVGLLQTERRHADTSAWGGEGQNVYQVIMHDLVNRVQGLATVHSMLSASEWDPLPLNELTVQIIYSSLQMLPRDRRVSVNVSPSPIRVTSDQAHDLALVINELVTNTVKHSMQERDEVCITVRIKLDEETVTLEFRDDGPGYPEEMLQSERSSVGFDLIRNIVRRNLRGDLELYNDLGAVAVIRFALLVTCD